MQEVIDREFAQQTVIAVMHRLRYIERYDRVALLKHGEMIECGSPTTLLGQDSEFRRVYTSVHSLP